MDPWKGRFNAEVYDRFVREQRIYRALNERLVELAEVGDARRILDLACGTGATAIECLKRMRADAEVVGVDASSDMVDVARANIRDPRAKFVVAPAASVGEVVSGVFDRVVCNASYWQFPAGRPVLDAISDLVRSNGRFVFNVPAERVVGETSPVHAFQVALARALEERMGGALPPAATMLDAERLAEAAAESGFEIAARERFVYRGNQGELADLMSIPAMLGPLAPDLAPAEREAALNAARSRIDPGQAVEVPWVYFVVRRRE